MGEQDGDGLVVAAQGGDNVAYEPLLGELCRVERRFFWSRLRDVRWAEDLVQEALLQVHCGRHVPSVNIEDDLVRVLSERSSRRTNKEVV